MIKIDALMLNNKFVSYMEQIKDKEIDREYCKHGIEHSLDVARISYIINLENSLGFDKEVIYGAALLHDIGRVCEYQNGTSHDKAGAMIAKELLTEVGFDNDDVELICEAIINHRESNKCNNEDCTQIISEEDKQETYSDLSGLLYKADKLSRNCFSCGVYDKCYWPEDLKNKKINI